MDFIEKNQNTVCIQSANRPQSLRGSRGLPPQTRGKIQFILPETGSTIIQAIWSPKSANTWLTSCRGFIVAHGHVCLASPWNTRWSSGTAESQVLKNCLDHIVNQLWPLATAFRILEIVSRPGVAARQANGTPIGASCTRVGPCALSASKVPSRMTFSSHV